MAKDDDDAAKLARIERRLAMLPRITRAVFLLARLDDLTYEEIGWRLRLDTEQVKRHCSATIWVRSWRRSG